MSNNDLAFELPEGLKSTPKRPTALTGVDAALDRSLVQAVVGSGHIAAIYTHAFDVQNDFLTYATEVRSAIEDATQGAYTDAITRQLVIANNQGVMSVANEAVRQIHESLSSPPASVQASAPPPALPSQGTGSSIVNALFNPNWEAAPRQNKSVLGKLFNPFD